MRRLIRGFNWIARPLAGRRWFPLWAVLHHRGRHSGRSYETPVAARHTADGFVILLAFGEGADWVRNVRAAGSGVVVWKGRRYDVVEPVVIDWQAARSAFNRIQRPLVRLTGLDRFLHLRVDRAAEPNETAGG